MWYHIQAGSYLRSPYHPGWAAGVPSPAGSCQRSRHMLEEGRAATPGPRHCTPKTLHRGYCHCCPHAGLAATPLRHPRVTLHRCTLPCSRAWMGRWTPTLQRPTAIPSPPPCPPAPPGPHPAAKNPRERLILGAGPAWCCRNSRVLVRQGQQRVAVEGSTCLLLTQGWQHTPSRPGKPGLVRGEPPLALFGQGRSIPSSCPEQEGCQGNPMPEAHRWQLSRAKPRGRKVLQCPLPAWTFSSASH